MLVNISTVQISYLHSCLIFSVVTQAPIDRCSPNPCFNNGLCFNSNEGSGFFCSCLQGFSGTICEVSTVTSKILCVWCGVNHGHLHPSSFFIVYIFVLLIIMKSYVNFDINGEHLMCCTVMRGSSGFSGTFYSDQRDQ